MNGKKTHTHTHTSLYSIMVFSDLHVSCWQGGSVRRNCCSVSFSLNKVVRGDVPEHPVAMKLPYPTQGMSPLPFYLPPPASSLLFRWPPILYPNLTGAEPWSSEACLRAVRPPVRSLHGARLWRGALHRKHCAGHGCCHRGKGYDRVSTICCSLPLLLWT